MESHLGFHFRETRLAKGMTLGQIARQVGYRNISKGCRRIDAFEKTGRVRNDLLTNIATVLEINDTAIREL